MNTIVENKGFTGFKSSYGLDKQGFSGARKEYWNLSVPELYEEIVARQEGQ